MDSIFQYDNHIISYNLNKAYIAIKKVHYDVIQEGKKQPTRGKIIQITLYKFLGYFFLFLNDVISKPLHALS